MCYSTKLRPHVVLILSRNDDCILPIQAINKDIQLAPASWLLKVSNEVERLPRDLHCWWTKTKTLQIYKELREWCFIWINYLPKYFKETVTTPLVSKMPCSLIAMTGFQKKYVGSFSDIKARSENPKLIAVLYDQQIWAVENIGRMYYPLIYQKKMHHSVYLWRPWRPLITKRQWWR